MLIRTLVSTRTPSLGRRLKRILAGHGALVALRSPDHTFWEAVSSQPVDLLVVALEDLTVPRARSVKALRQLDGTPAVVVLSDNVDKTERANMLAAGAHAVLPTDLSDELMSDTLRSLLEFLQSEATLRVRATESNDSRLTDFVTASPAMQHMINVAKRVARSDASLLIVGETGVGKERLARAIHADGPRGAEPFVPVNCGAIPAGLVESQLFGHRAGAFTGAYNDHRGFFEIAHGGTIFLDEVSETPPELQVKLLRVLQEQSFMRIGGERRIRANVRVIAATNRDPAEEMAAGRLREDLYYRIGVVTLAVPPLRERRPDIPDLAQNYFEIFNFKIKRGLKGIRPDAMEALVHYDWPGNVRELINIMERAVLLANHSEIMPADLPLEVSDSRSTRLAEDVRVGESEPPRSNGITDAPLRQARRKALDAFERRYLTELLTKTQGRVGDAAAWAGISTRALYERLRRHNIRKERFKPRRPSPVESRE